MSSTPTAALGEPPGLPKADLEPITVIHAEFARQLQLVVPAVLHCDITAKVAEVRQDTYAGFRRERPSTVYLCPLALSPDGRSAALHLSPELVFPMLETMMGGTISTSPDLERKLTLVEEEVLEPLIQTALNTLARAWRPVVEVEFRRGSGVPMPHETVVVVTIEIELGPDTRGMLSLALPSVLLRKAKPREEVPAPPEFDGPSAELMLKRIEPAMLEFEARLNGPKVGLQDLLDMKEGQIVLLDNAADQGVDGLVNKAPHFRGQIVSDGKKRLLLIENFREPDRP